MLPTASSGLISHGLKGDEFMTRTPAITITLKSTNELVQRTRDLLKPHECLCIQFYNPLYIVQSQQVLLLLNSVTVGISTFALIALYKH